MPIRHPLLFLALLLGAPTVQAQADPHAGHHAAAPADAARPADPAQPAIAVVEDFSAALKAGDLDRVAALLADDVLVLESGRVRERGSTSQVLSSPQDAYTRRLLDAAPSLPTP